MASWVLVAILAALCFAVVNVFDKYLLSGLNLDPEIPLVGLGMTGLIVSLVILFIKGFTVPAWPHLLLALVGGAVYALMNVFYLEAAKRDDISRVAPLFHLSPFYILIFSYFFLGETLTRGQYVGVFLLVAGAIMLGYKKGNKFIANIPFFLMLLAAFFWAGNQVITKYLLNFNDFWIVFAYIRIGTFLVLIPDLLASMKNFKKIYRLKGVHPFAAIGAGELFNLGGILLAAIAATDGSITLVNALSSAQPLFLLIIVVSLSVFYPRTIKEEFVKGLLYSKLAAIAFLIVGAILIE